ncbi:HAMP domain-containing histidine kinase [Vibrio makurazakiensis]
MFVRLYIGSIVGLVSTIWLFITLGDGYMRRTEIETFLNDGNYFVEQYIQQHNDPQSLYKSLDLNHRQQFYIFELELINRWDGLPPCETCELAYKLNGIPVYLNGDDLYTAVFPLPNSSHSFVFNESRDFFSPEIEWYEDSERHFLIALLLAVFLAIGCCIYLPVYRLQCHIQNLVNTQKRFGLGKLTTRANTNLPKPISELSNSFNEMAEEIESKVKQSHIFSQAIPHEVRTPLSRIQLATDLLRRQAPKSQQALFRDIDTYIDDINDLTSQIMMLSKLNVMDNSFFELVKINVDLAEYCQERIRYAKFNNFIFTSYIEVGSRSKFDCTMARLIIDNIMKNANSYTTDTVWISLDQNTESWLLIIEDNGVGIPSEKREEVLMPFSRLDESRSVQKQSGFGLGLAIAKSAAKKLDWGINISDSKHGGARFTVVIPKHSNK